MRRYLVFVRAGKASLHHHWLAQDLDRNWDCCVNVWGEPPAMNVGAEPEWQEEGGLNKFQGFLEIYPRVLAQHLHRYVMLLDDDLEFAPGALSRFFRYCDAENLNLCQPAIRLGSHANHVLNIRNLLTLVRRVNFVEVMAPCFHRESLEYLMPTFSLSQCTWGIDWAWSALLADKGRLAVIDAVSMHHTKPMDVSGGPFYQRLKRMGIDPAQELAAIHQRYPIREPMHTRRDGHRYRMPLPQAMNAALVAEFERQKLWLHLKRGGTLAQQTPVVDSSSVRFAATPSKTGNQGV
jgi:hypothetical protein